MPTYAADRPQPILKVNATISPSSFSFSNQAEMLLILTLDLDAPEPVSMYIPPSFLARREEYESPYRLIHVRTGHRLDKTIVSRLRVPLVEIQPEKDLLTLYPGTPVVRIVWIGLIDFQSRYPLCDQGPQVCATPVDKLQVGERYRVGVDQEVWDRPAFWWWERGTLEQVVQAHPPSPSSNTFIGKWMSILAGEVRVVMVDEPEFVVVP